jgi:hypothetical protein
MDDDVLAAATRLRRLKAGESLAAVYGPLCETHGHEGNLWLCDRAALADAYLAEHPADDAEPCGHDPGWLRSAGFGPFYGALVYDATPCPGRVMVDPGGRLLLSGGVVAERPTRGDVLALLRGLKVPAKEGR